MVYFRDGPKSILNDKPMINQIQNILLLYTKSLRPWLIYAIPSVLLV